MAKIKATIAGSYNATVCVSIFMYADDIVLLSLSVTGLQTLLTACESELIDLDMRLNVMKSICMRFGHRFNAPCASIVSSNGPLKWVTSCRYLGVFFSSGRQFRCCFDNAKISFYRAFNSIMGKVGRFASEEVLISLLVTKCFPCLLYGVEACPLLARNKSSFDFLLTRTFMKLFRTGSPVVVKQCQLQFNVLPLHFQLDIRTAKFLEDFVSSTNSICALFKHRATLQLHNLCAVYGDHIKSSRDIFITSNELFAKSVLLA